MAVALTPLRSASCPIAYVYEDLDAGGRVRLTTTDQTALAAVHEFLRYQIREHGTGDRLTPAK